MTRTAASASSLPCQEQAGGSSPAACPTLRQSPAGGGRWGAPQPSLPHPALGLRGWNRVSSGANHPPLQNDCCGPVESHGFQSTHKSVPSRDDPSPWAPSVKGGALAPSQFRENQSASLWIPGLFSFPRPKLVIICCACFYKRPDLWVFWYVMWLLLSRNLQF